MLVAVNHSLASYDGFLLALAIFEETGRIPAGLAHDRLFQLPLIGDLVRDANMTPASPQAGARLLREGQMVFLAPGGMREAIRPEAERYRVSWADRLGFARLALRTGVPVLLAACPAADDIYTVMQMPWTQAVYRRFKLPLPLAWGHRGSPLPRPVKLDHYIAPPFTPPAHDPYQEEEQVEAFHRQLVEGMQALMSANAPLTSID